MSSKDKPITLVDEHQALSLYMEALLKEPLAAPVYNESSPETTLLPSPTEVPQEEELQLQRDGIPTWGESSFQVLMFRVAGLTLAVPLSELSGVQVLDHQQLTPMPGHSPWYLGLTEYRERNVPIIDTAQMVLPVDRLQTLADDILQRIVHVVYIDDGRWGLGCEAIAEVLTLTPEQVSWRSARTSRRWLAGTVLEQMCALIEPSAFAEMLSSGLMIEDS